MEQDPLLLKDQADGMDVVAADRMEALKKKDGPSKAKPSQYGSWYSMSRTCGPRDIISLVIPKLGDNKCNSFMEVWFMFKLYSILTSMIVVLHVFCTNIFLKTEIFVIKRTLRLPNPTITTQLRSRVMFGCNIYMVKYTLCQLFFSVSPGQF
jgi:hypothetical protein